MDLERKESRWASFQNLEDDCQFGFVLPFDLFFSYRCSHYAMCGTVWCLRENTKPEEPHIFLVVILKVLSGSLMDSFSLKLFTMKVGQKSKESP